MLEAIDVLGLSPAQGAAALGIQVSSLDLIDAGTEMSGGIDVMVRAWMLVSIAESLRGLVPSPADWMAAPNFLLVRSPADHLGTAEGLGRILDVLRTQRRLQGGMPAEG